MQKQNLSQVDQRKESLKRLLKMGIDPFPSKLVDINSNSKDIKQKYNENSEERIVKIAGRLMRRRVMGKASFAEIQDESGRIQLYLNRDEICKGEEKSLYNEIFKKLIDIGDIIYVIGNVFKTKLGEISVNVRELTILSKSLRPLPLPKTDSDGKEYDSFSDTESRYRKRYVDLIVNPDVKKTFILRAKLINSMRSFLNKKGYTEVETPILQPIYGGASAKPFVTYHNKLDMQLYLRIANELYLKRLIVGGFEGVYEFAKDFRNEGMSRFHNPEFTQMELYVAYKDYNWMMDLVEKMVEKIALDLHGTTKVTYDNREIDFKSPWKRSPMFDIIKESIGIDISNMGEEGLKNLCKELKINIDPSMGKAKLIDAIFGEKCEKNIVQPTFVTDYPIEMSPLAKKHRFKKGLVERFEAIVNGKELCNAFSELNDPIDQKLRFEKQVELRKKGDEESMLLDLDYIRALEHGMPPTAGLGIGIDRLTMLMTDSKSIQDVLFFPQMKKQNDEN